MTLKAKLEVKRNGLTFQDLFLKLAHFWGKQGCVLQQPYDTEVGAGTMAPETFLRVLGPSPYRVAYVQPSRRPADGRYGENPNRLYKHYQYQVILKPSPANIQDMYLKSLEAIGIDLRAHDVRFEEDNWEAPTLGAWGIGWQVLLDGLEITQFTYFQQSGGIELDPISVELTYGLERICAFLQDVESVYEIRWNEEMTYGDVRLAEEQQLSEYSFDRSDPQALRAEFELHEKESREVLEGWKHLEGNAETPSIERLRYPLLAAYDHCLKCSHLFNLMDARGADGACTHPGMPRGRGVPRAGRGREERGADMKGISARDSWSDPVAKSLQNVGAPTSLSLQLPVRSAGACSRFHRAGGAARAYVALAFMPAPLECGALAPLLRLLPGSCRHSERSEEPASSSLRHKQVSCTVEWGMFLSRQIVHGNALAGRESMAGFVGRGFSRDISCLGVYRASAPEELLLTFPAACKETPVRHWNRHPVASNLQNVGAPTFLGCGGLPPLSPLADCLPVSDSKEQVTTAQARASWHTSKPGLPAENCRRADIFLKPRSGVEVTR